MLDLLVITGASKGIGRSITTNLMDHAKKIVLISSSNSINNIKHKGIKSPKNFYVIQEDISNFDAVSKKIAALDLQINKCNKVGLIFCASQLGSVGGIFKESISEIASIININTLGNLNIFQNVAKEINTQCVLRGIFFAGGGAAYGYPNFFGYSLSKVSIVRAVENISIEMKEIYKNSSVVALAPGAVATDMLSKVIASGGFVKTKTDISEPVNFVKSFLLDEIDSLNLNGCFLHVRDDFLKNIPSKLSENHFKLRRVE